jgi:hypothetical protein
MIRFRGLIVFVLIFAAAWPSQSSSTQSLRVKIAVSVKEKPKEQPKPFADVSGFVIRRSTTDYKNASCPDASNSGGELVCRIMCNGADGDLRLQVFAPLKEKARIVAGLTPPCAAAIDVVACKVMTPQPVRLVYRSAEVVFDELLAWAPDVYSAIVVTGDPTNPKIRNFSDATEDLRVLAAKKENRDAILEFSKLAAQLKSGDASNMSTFGQYAAGGQSLVFQSLVSHAAGASTGALVKVSPDPADLQRSVGIVAKELDKKLALNAHEIKLFTGVQQIKAGDPSLIAAQLQNMNANIVF